MNRKLTQSQRLIAALTYLLIVGISFSLLGGNISKILDSSYDQSIWFYSGVLLIIMGQYVTEPFFSTPADSLANSITLLFALLTVNNKNTLIGYSALLFFSICMIFISIISILCKDKRNKFSNFIYVIVKSIGSSKFIYSLVFILSSCSYFANNEYMSLFIISIAVWISIVFLGLVERIIKFIAQLKNTLISTEDNNFLGCAIRCSSIGIYTIKTEKNKKNILQFSDRDRNIVFIKTDKETYSLGLVTSVKTSLESFYIDVSLICDDQNMPITVPQSEMINIAHNIHLPEVLGASWNIGIAYLNKTVKEKIERSTLYKNFNSFIGYVEQNSDINTINFRIIENNSLQIKDGLIISTFIYGQEVLYQIINGFTKKEIDDCNSSTGYICGLARKLGVYDKVSSQLNIVKWIPAMGEKVFLHKTEKDINLKAIADSAIGRIPETAMAVKIADVNSLVTHNTAILGILGVGKSCLTFEIIKKITKNKVKAICIDITNQYYTEKGLLGYISNELIINDIDPDKQSLLQNYSKATGADSKPSAWGNVEKYKACLKLVLEEFVNGDKDVLIMNPDKHIVTKPATLFKISELIELSVVEKTRIISEVLLEIYMGKGQSDVARVCIIYEEAHSLIPEWNSVANKGDEQAANGTAKVILQGRKYGLGCIIVTQRTANVTKSILNQCNTIFALRVFDDTGKTFLENYIGKDYSDTLSTLDERHAIAIGRALKLKQPVIIQLNDMKYLLEERDQERTLEKSKESINKSHEPKPNEDLLAVATGADATDTFI